MMSDGRRQTTEKFKRLTWKDTAARSGKLKESSFVVPEGHSEYPPRHTWA